MRIGFVTDEISTNVRQAIELGVSWGVRDYELRVIGENRIPHISQDQIQTIVDLKNEHGIRITAVSPGTGKGTLQDKELLEREFDEVLPATFKLAKNFGARLLIVFGIQRSEADKPEDEKKVIEVFQQIADEAQKHDLIVAVENEPGFWCDDGKNTARIVKKVNSPAFKVNWDPGNAFGTDETPFPDGYQSVKDLIVNVHVKDTSKGALVECAPVGEGKIDWQGQLKALVQDRLVEHVTIETHCTPLIEKSKKNLRVVSKILAEV